VAGYLVVQYTGPQDTSGHFNVLTRLLARENFIESNPAVCLVMFVSAAFNIKASDVRGSANDVLGKMYVLH
jgi:hypothetical protein